MWSHGNSRARRISYMELKTSPVQNAIVNKQPTDNYWPPGGSRKLPPLPRVPFSWHEYDRSAGWKGCYDDLPEQQAYQRANEIPDAQQVTLVNNEFGPGVSEFDIEEEAPARVPHRRCCSRRSIFLLAKTKPKTRHR